MFRFWNRGGLNAHYREITHTFLETPMNRDLLNSTAAHAVAVSAFQVIDQLQDLPKTMQVNALAVLYKLFTEELKLNHSELLTRADLIVMDADKYFRHEIKALRDYIREEIKK